VAEFIDRCRARPLPRGARHALARRALSRDQQRFIDAFNSIRRIDLSQELARISCPTVVIHGKLGPRTAARTRWFWFLWAAGVAWDQAARSDARDFCRWLQLAGKPARPHWRSADQPQPGAVPGEVYAPSVRAHSETVLRSFYDFHREAGTGPLVNPFPLDRSRRGGRACAAASTAGLPRASRPRTCTTTPPPPRRSWTGSPHAA
jgi:hypothetical protein